MLVARELLWLPIHNGPREAFESARREDYEQRRARLADLWSMPYEAIPVDVRAGAEDHWNREPWYVGDVLGALCLGHDGGRCLAGDVFLRRKHFPRGAPERLGTVKKPTRVMDEFIHYAETARHELTGSGNDQYLRMAGNVIREANQIVRQALRRGLVWTPPFGLDCMDLAKADRRLTT